MASQGQNKELIKQAYAKSAGFTWLLGRKPKEDRPNAAQLAEMAFDAVGQDHAANLHQDNPGRSGWVGPSATATRWGGEVIEQDNAGAGHAHTTALGMEEEEEEEVDQQHTKTHGFCVRPFKNGWYKGEINQGHLEGYGIFVFENGEEYEGEWVNNRMSGRGKYFYRDGSYYEGEYLAGKKHGIGLYVPTKGEASMLRYEYGKIVQSGEAIVYNTDTNDTGITSLDLQNPDHVRDDHSEVSETFNHESGGREGARQLLNSLNLSEDIYQLPQNYVEYDSDDSQFDEEEARRQEERERKLDAQRLEEERLAAKRVLNMEGVVEEVRRLRNVGIDNTKAEQEKMQRSKHMRETAILGLHNEEMIAEENERKEEEAKKKAVLWGEEEDDDEADLDGLLNLDDEGDVPPEMVFVFLKNEEVQRMAQDIARKGSFQDQLLREIVSVVQCSFKMLSIFSCEPAVIPAERANATEVLGQTIRPAGQSKMFKVTDEFDKTKYVRALRVGLLVWIKGTRNKIKPSRVALWQREKAEWILQSYHTNEILGTWKKFHYLCFASKIELAGPWDVIKDQPYESRLIVEGLSQKQFQSTEENQAIWSHRFMKRYGNPTLLVLDPRQRDQLLMTLNKRISEAEVKMTKTFAVRKRLNAYQDGPRVFILDMANQCIVNELPQDFGEEDSEKKKRRSLSLGSRVRKTIRFEDIKHVLPHPMQDTHVTITFKTRQRDYEFDFPIIRDRIVFMRRMKMILRPECFPEVQKTEAINRVPNYFESKEKSAMRSNISAITETGKLPWNYDRFGNPQPTIQYNHMKGQTAHPDAALDNDGLANAANCAIPPNAITPGLSNQQAAYVQQRPEVAHSFYGNSVYRSNVAMSAVGSRYEYMGGDNLSTSASRTGRSRGSRGVRHTRQYLGDDSRSMRSFTTAKTPVTAATGASQTFASFSIREGLSVRGNRHGQVQGIGDLGEFTAADHCIAYKMLNRIPDDQQLTELQTKEAVLGQYAELAVKERMQKEVANREDAQHRRKTVFKRLVTDRGFAPNKEVLEEVAREMLGLEETKRFRRLMDLGRAQRVREQLAFPLAFPVPKKLRPTEEHEGAEHISAEEGDDQVSRNSGSLYSQRPRSGISQDISPRDELRHVVLGERVLEARMPEGNLLHDNYLILSHVTKQPMVKVQKIGNGILFADEGVELASFHVVSKNRWRCTTFGAAQDFEVTEQAEDTGHKTYTLRQFGQVFLMVSWIQGTIFLKTPNYSLGSMKRDVGQGKWTFMLDKKEAQYPFFLLWGAGWAAEHTNTPVFPFLPLEFPKFWTSSPRDELRHVVLGERVLEARMPEGNLLRDNYLILSHVTKQPMVKVQKIGNGILFADEGVELASFHVVSKNRWRCTTFGAAQDFEVTEQAEDTGHKTYTLRQFVQFGQVFCIIDPLGKETSAKRPTCLQNATAVCDSAVLPVCEMPLYAALFKFFLMDAVDWFVPKEVESLPTHVQ